MSQSRTKETLEQDLLVGIVDRNLPASAPIESRFAELYTRCHDRAIAVATRYIGKDAASDVVNQTALELWKRRDKLTPEQWSPRFFMLRVRARIMKEMRRSARWDDLPDDDSGETERMEVPDVGIAYEGQELGALVQKLVEAMPPKRRAVWTLFMDRDLTYDEIVELLGIAESTIAKHITHARAYLKEAVEGAGYRLSERTMRGLLSGGGQGASDTAEESTDD